MILFLFLINISWAGTEYYASFVGYDHPIQLTEKIEKKNIKTRVGSYYRAEYKDKKLISVTKYYKFKEEQSYQYTYRTDGSLLETKIYRIGKRISILSYNKKGELKDIKKEGL